MADQKQITRRFGRYAVALAVGSFAAVSLLWLMQFLIATGQAAITEVLDIRFVDFVEVKKKEIIETKPDKPERPPEPDEAPPTNPPDNPDVTDFDTALAVPLSDPILTTGLDNELGGFILNEGEYLPLRIVEAVYPRRAQSRALEGYCDLELTVTPLGTTADVIATHCTSSLFERASIQAALKFKYKPRVVDGTPIAVPGVQYRMTFRIED